MPLLPIDIEIIAALPCGRPGLTTAQALEMCDDPMFCRTLNIPPGTAARYARVTHAWRRLEKRFGRQLQNIGKASQRKYTLTRRGLAMANEIIEKYLEGER